MFPSKIKGLLFVNEQSVLYVKDTDVKNHYFSPSSKIYSDKLSKFVIRSNEKSKGAVVDRLQRIYTHLYIDEVQDLAGYDLDILQLLFSSDSEVLLVGDPRQVTYLTHHAKLHSPYRNGEIKKFITDKRLACTIDDTTLNKSHRNNAPICFFSSKLYPKLPASEPCDCPKCRNTPPDHEGTEKVLKN